MELKTQLLSKAAYSALAIEAHKECFGNEYIDEAVNFDAAILITEKDKNVLYGIIKELDKETAYISFGGIFKDYRGKGLGHEAFGVMVKALKEKYKRVGFITKTKNTAMIKLGLNEKFEIIGMKQVYKLPHLEFLLEREN